MKIILRYRMLCTSLMMFTMVAAISNYVLRYNDADRFTQVEMGLLNQLESEEEVIKDKPKVYNLLCQLNANYEEKGDAIFHVAQLYDLYDAHVCTPPPEVV